MSNAFSELYSCNKNLTPRMYSAGNIGRRSEIRRDDFQPDSSLLGLVYPSGMLDAFNEKMKATVDEIIRKNTINNGGLMRYPGDVYCGGVNKGWVTLSGAGAWPLLNFWMAIYQSLCNNRKNAERYFRWPLERIDKYIPEQIFKSKMKSSICPLVWSHAMFVIAAKFLKYI